MGEGVPQPFSTRGAVDIGNGDTIIASDGDIYTTGSLQVDQRVTISGGLETSGTAPCVLRGRTNLNQIELNQGRYLVVDHGDVPSGSTRTYTTWNRAYTVSQNGSMGINIEDSNSGWFWDMYIQIRQPGAGRIVWKKDGVDFNPRFLMSDGRYTTSIDNTGWSLSTTTHIVFRVFSFGGGNPIWVSVA